MQVSALMSVKSGVSAMPQPWLSSHIIFYLHVCAELNYDSAPPAGGLNSLSFVPAACPPFPNKNLALLYDNKYKWNTPCHYLYSFPHPPSLSLTPCALQIKERVYEPALAWHRWWGVITVERLSCSLRTLPLSSLGQEHDAKKKKKNESTGKE